MRSELKGWVAGLALLAGSAQAADTVVDDAYLANGGDGGNWPAYGRTSTEQRYSPLDQINAGNVKKLGIEWVLDLPKERSLIATPLVVDGVIYFTGSYSHTYAVDARTGKQLWEFDPKTIERAGDRLRIMWDINRGPAYYKGKLIISTVDGRLVALDAKTGKQLWEAMTVDPRKSYYVNGAPKVFRDKVIIGNGGTEHEAARGYVTAYDVNTGKQAWRFYIVPGNPADGFESKAMEMAAKTWTGEWWKHGGGGNVWNGMTYDAEFNQVLIGTGNGSPWNQKIRSPGGGDNLFLCSIVAVDADTGEYKWHYQTNPGETWDYNANMDIVLADVKYGGQTVKALLQAPKNGFFYIINRANGELLSAEKFGKATWAERIDLKTGRPVEVKGARYEDGEEIVWPGPWGAHNWHAMSYNPNTGLVYIPAYDMPGAYKDTGMDLAGWQSPHFRVDPGVEFKGEDAPADIAQARLLAWDPMKQAKAWSHELPPMWNAGTMTTKGNLVFQGRADGEFVAYDAAKGDVLWSMKMGLGISSAPVTYTVDGKQYVSLLVGWGGGGTILGSLAAQHGWKYKLHPRRLYTFALDGKAPLPPSPPPTLAKPLEAPEFKVDTALAEHGRALYAASCLYCHGAGMVSGGTAPDLRESPIPTNREAFEGVVRKGALRPNGMPQFAELTDKDIDGLMHFIRLRARESLSGVAAR
ncbi:MAG: PQQ-dependent dehydrogenase, methanol/ethanol family [Gammaproteobacteria bacterium]|jgi:quinohemoprotein ethanol dehydrogenase|nr:PQQ-dependent dehydrogenase, methanol/ethanol family [Gammaproteobacteria bacterium]